MPVRIHEVELRRVRLPLVRPFRTATDFTTTKEALLVRVGTDAGDGWGECSAQRTAAYLPETIDTARLALRDLLVPRLFAHRPFTDVRGFTTAKAALECAYFDAQLRADGVALSTALGGTRPWVDAGVAIGLTDSLAELRVQAADYVARGYGRLKLKIAPGADVTVVREVRAEVGDTITLQADANGSYGHGTGPDGRDAHDALLALDEFGLQCIEQPLAPDALVASAALGARIRTPICLDESITSATVAGDAIALGAGRVVSLKAARLGGMEEARRVHDVCAAAGVPTRAGGMLETGVGRAALLAVASLPACSVPGDVSASDRYFAQDVTEPFVLENGQLRVPTGPGLGVTVRLDVLDRCTVARELIVAPR